MGAFVWATLWPQEAGSTHLVGYSHNLNQHTQANQKGDYGKRE
jgi:hypothetical protein